MRYQNSEEYSGRGARELGGVGHERRGRGRRGPRFYEGRDRAEGHARRFYGADHYDADHSRGEASREGPRAGRCGHSDAHDRQERRERRAAFRAARAALRQAMHEGRGPRRHGGGFAGHFGGRHFGGGPFGTDGPFGPGGPFGPSGPFGSDGPFGGGGGRGRGGGRRRKRFDGEELRLLMLKLIGDEPRHGYDIIREIESLSDGAYAPSPGLVYPTLTLLADMDLIAEQGEGGARKSYAITDAGKAELDAKADAVKAVLERLGSFAGRGGRDSIAPALRAMQNLAATTRNKVMQSARTGEMSQEDLFKIVDIIDEAAQKIERL